MTRKQLAYQIIRQNGGTTDEKIAQDLCCSVPSALAILRSLEAGGLLRSIGTNEFEPYFRQGQEYIVTPIFGFVDSAYGEEKHLLGARVTISESWPPDDTDTPFDFHVNCIRFIGDSTTPVANRIHISNLAPLPTIFRN